ncbi:MULTISPECIES: copper-binding protein [Pseudomonas]|uniref:copper-binding protein n=1 Tax=Pseudomonas TaxID=286 RepID=UPI000CFE6721|nr:MULTISPECIES: copper-binding protein [Pseudomonas]NNB13393.1 copper-binding protein [Pseudomonas fragi]NNB21940.1 copper-binding protein [Pseudomonas fragi]PRA60046.1 heat-shock protein HtpX [Pseudomonas sp. MYb115]QXN50055.1 copper-binding protein [Pseudomonas fluorescens]WSO24373.1 copper-binding protein [Pseudomonas fluorescens]
MKLTMIAVASTVFALSLSVHAEDMPGMKMEGMEMKQETKQAPVATVDGTIKAIDPTKHTVTIAHGAVPSVQWPPMTMAFSATEDQLTGLAAGDRVSFSFRLEGGKATIVSIRK